MFAFQISMGGMKYDGIKQCGKRCKELGPLTGVSLPPAATYEEVIGRNFLKEFLEKKESTNTF